MASLYTLCYPNLAAADRSFIDAFRREHDGARGNMVAPHFTLVFAIDGVPEPDYRRHVATIARSQAPFAFRCRHAMVGCDDAKENFYVYLVPEEGQAAMSNLHDRLYRGVFAPYLRLDIAYIPHIGIATGPDALHIKALCDGINAGGLDIPGSVDAITVCTHDGAKIANLETFALCPPQPPGSYGDPMN